MRDLHELNINSRGKPVVTPTPTAGQIAFVERLIDAPIPPAYVTFLKFSNGGHPELSAFYIDTDGQHELWSINNFFHISSESEVTQDTEDVVWNYVNFLRRYWVAGSRAILPIARDGGDNLICLDLRVESQEKVVLWVHDDPHRPLQILASSFTEFVNSLSTYPDDL